MVELSGIQQTVQKVTEQAVQDQAKKGVPDKAAASAEDVEKLQAALNQQPTGANPAAQVQEPPKVEGVQAAGHSSPGSKILEGMGHVRSGYQQALQELQQTLSSSNLSSPADLMKIQLKLQQVTIQQDLMSKVVSKAEQNLETLQKGQ